MTLSKKKEIESFKNVVWAKQKLHLKNTLTKQKTLINFPCFLHDVNCIF